MSLLSTLALGANVVGGLLGDDKAESRETTSTPSVTPELQNEIDNIFSRIEDIFNKPYPEYPGERVAGPTENRSAMDTFLGHLQNGQMNNRALGVNQYQDRVNELANMTPFQLEVPTLLGQYGAGGVRTSGGYGSAPVSELQSTTENLPTYAGDYAPWTQGLTYGQTQQG